MSYAASNLFSVHGKRALVTGGGSGIGENMATALVHNGAHVIIASRKEKSLQEVSDRLNKEGPGTCEYIVANIVDKAGCEKLVAEIKNRVDSLDIVVNNSGATWGAPIDNMPEKEAWDRILGTNVKALYYVTVGLMPLLKKNATQINPGRVVNISSMASVTPRASGGGMSAEGDGMWSYSVSKAAVNHLTSTLAVTLAPELITCNAILPGVFPSRMSNYGIQEHGDAIKASQPMGRWGYGEDIGGTLLFLVSRAGAHVTGAHVPLDGGSTISGGKGGKKEEKL